MVITLKNSLQSIKRTNIQESFNNYCSQIICLFNELTFSAKTATSISSGRSAIQSLGKQMQGLLSDLTKRCHLTKDQLILAKIKSLILDVIHQITVLQFLSSQNCQGTADWSWHKQLKIVQERSGVRLHMANANFDYSF